MFSGFDSLAFFDEQVVRFPALDDTQVVPLFLIVRGRKPGNSHG